MRGYLILGINSGRTDLNKIEVLSQLYKKYRPNDAIRLQTDFTLMLTDRYDRIIAKYPEDVKLTCSSNPLYLRMNYSLD